MKRIRANGVDFAYLEEGGGPLVLLLHGFPDTARSWSHQMPTLAEAGFRAVAPYLRGYPPTEIPRDGFYDMGTLATDTAELIQSLGGGTPAYIVGQDWGAGITYSVLAAFPELVRRAVVMAVPHRAQVARSMLRQARPPLLPLVVLPTRRSSGESDCRKRLRLCRLSLGILGVARLSGCGAHRGHQTHAE